MFRRILSIRLSVLAVMLFVFFFIFLNIAKTHALTAGQLALFSVNSFLFGYYFNPLLTGQKTRVASLNEVTRQETMVLLDILTQSHLLKPVHRHQLKVKLKVYLDDLVDNHDISADNRYYDELLHWTKSVKGDDQGVLDVIYSRISTTQVNRDKLANLFATKIYSHEWLVAGVLFSITLFFATQTQYGHSLFFAFMLAVLCAGLCMLMAILIKFATLTHKEAKRMWDPLKELDAKHFEDVDRHEVAVEKARIDALPA